MPLKLEEAEHMTITNISNFVEDISALYLNQKFSDITINVSGEKIFAHKVILAARSDYFEGLLYGDSVESAKAAIIINDVPPYAFRLLLKYIYTSTITLEPSNMNLTLEVMGLAHQYSFSLLESSIVTKLKTMLNLENICSILNMTSLYDIIELRDACLSFMDKHATQILTGDCFNELTETSMLLLLQRDSFFAPEIEIFKGVAKWCKSNNRIDSRVDNMEKCVRLSWLTVVEIVSSVWPSRLFDNEILLTAIAEYVNVKPRTTHCRAQLLVDENIATPGLKAEVISGTNPTFLLNGNRDNTKYTTHTIGDQSNIMVKLGNPSFINHIHMMLWDGSTRYYSYYIEISMDQRKWKKVIDYRHCSCRSYQSLYFEEEIAQYIRVTGTQNNENIWFHLIFFETYYKTKIPRTINGIVCPITNVATLDKQAVVIEGDVPSALLNGDTKNYDGSKGFSSHIIGSGAIVVQLAQPYVISSLKMLLWDQDGRSYKYYIEASLNKIDWEIIVDRKNEECKSWQTCRFNERAVVYIRITGTHNTVNEGFHCVHFECPATETK